MSGWITEWIQVKDRLPKDGQMIAACSDKMQLGCICRFCANEEEKLPCLKYGPLSCLGISWKDITHWTELPKPAEKNSKCNKKCWSCGHTIYSEMNWCARCHSMQEN